MSTRRLRAVRSPAAHARLTGLDTARGLAFVGMLLSHYVASTRTGDPGWLRTAADLADGRAAPLFCVLLGVGCGLYLRGRPPMHLARRGAVLLAVGLAVWPFVDRVFLILPQYGVLAALAALSPRLPTRGLLPGAACSWIVPSAIVAVVDGHALRTAGQPDSYGALLDVPAIARQVLWTGAYPIIGWAGFVLVGLWVARQPLARRATQLRLLGIGAVVVALQPAATAVFDALGGVDRPRGDARGLATFFDAGAHSNQTAWYAVTAGSAVAVIGLCLLGHRWLTDAPALLGRNALSAYLLHLPVGALVIWPWRDEQDPTLVAQAGAAVAVVVSITVLTYAWSRRFGRGPAELAVRTVAP